MSYELYLFNKRRYSLRLWVLFHYNVGISFANTRLILHPRWQSAGNLPFNVLDQFLELQNILVVEGYVFVEEWSLFDVLPHPLLEGLFAG